MAKITAEDVLYISKLARISLNKEEIEKFRKELSSILDFVSELQGVNTNNVEPLSSVAGANNVLRKDKILNNNNREELLQNTPKTKDGAIVTNKVLGDGPSA